MDRSALLRNHSSSAGASGAAISEEYRSALRLLGGRTVWGASVATLDVVEAAAFKDQFEEIVEELLARDELCRLHGSQRNAPGPASSFDHCG